MKKYLLFAIVVFSLFFVSPKAATSSGIPLTIFGSSVPTSFDIEGGGYKSGTAVLVTYDVLDTMPYVVLDICSTGGVDFSISNNGYTSYFSEDSVLTLNTKKKCKIGNYDGVIWKVQFMVGKFGSADSAGEVVVSSYVKLVNNYGYYGFYRITNAYLSDEDVLTPLINSSNDSQKQQEQLDEQKKTNSKLDDVKGKQDEAEKTRKGILGTIKDVLSNIINLPKKIVEFLVDALKSLFVPTDDQLYEIVNDSKELSENFGFVGEAVAFFLNIFTGLLGMVNANGCIEMPAFKIGATSLFDEHTFWEARNVCLADNTILSANIDTIRTITSIAFVSLFLGFAASKFFGILSKNDSGTSITYDENDNSFTVNDWSRTNGITYNRRYKS